MTEASSSLKVQYISCSQTHSKDLKIGCNSFPSGPKTASKKAPSDPSSLVSMSLQSPLPCRVGLACISHTVQMTARDRPALGGGHCSLPSVFCWISHLGGRWGPRRSDGETHATRNRGLSHQPQKLSAVFQSHQRLRP